MKRLGGTNSEQRFPFFKNIVVLLIVLALSILPSYVVVFAQDGRISIVILHTNDVHGNIWAEESTSMGYAHMAYKVNEIRKIIPMYY